LSHLITKNKKKNIIFPRKNLNYGLRSMNEHICLKYLIYFKRNLFNFGQIFGEKNFWHTMLIFGRTVFRLDSWNFALILIVLIRTMTKHRWCRVCLRKFALFVSRCRGSLLRANSTGKFLQKIPLCQRSFVLPCYVCYRLGFCFPSLTRQGR